jgi:hypothetical protein
MPKWSSSSSSFWRLSSTEAAEDGASDWGSDGPSEGEVVMVEDVAGGPLGGAWVSGNVRVNCEPAKVSSERRVVRLGVDFDWKAVGTALPRLWGAMTEWRCW